ncbi:MAG: glutamate--tRNA ligase [Methanobacteriota archaeon]|nr:MAG: glutamate--tRNA ligase [Euryarchaeota archaeon]
MDIIETAKKIALENAAKYGKADKGKVVGKLMGLFKERKEEVKELLPKIEEIVGKVNEMPREELKRYEKKKEKVKEERVIRLPNAKEGAVVTRFPPEPSGYLHIGHAKAASINYEGAINYSGRMVLRIDDTNPEKCKAEYEEAIKEDIEWLGIEPSSTSHTSDNMELIYERAKELINKGKAYVCKCSKEEITGNRRAGKACEHRKASKEKNMEEFEKMLSGEYGDGEALLRYVGDMESKNTTMRDPSLARIISREHYRKGSSYVVWPSYDLAVVVMDSKEGITHAIRSKEYELRGELYKSLLNDLSLPDIELIHISRLSVPGYPISKRDMRKLVEEGLVQGWDDPRLLTIRGMKRRGIVAEALRRFSLSFGLGKQENPADLSILLKENRKVLDKRSERYFMVEDGIEIAVEGDVPDIVEVQKKPDSSETRAIIVGTSVLVERSDWESLEDGEVVRLKGLGTFRVEKEAKKLSTVEEERKGLPKLQWIGEEREEVELWRVSKPLNEDGSFNKESLKKSKATVEKAALNIEEGNIIQFERKGFARLDNKERRVFIMSEGQ